MCSQIPNSVIEMFYDCNIYNIKTQESNPCIVIFYTVDLCTFRLVETVTELQNKYSESGGKRNVLGLCTLENNKAIYFLCTSLLFSSGIADICKNKYLC